MDHNTKVFISHATEDKDTLARGFAEALRKRCHVWYDEYSLPFGASIFHSISAGLRDCDFGVVILSENFFRKQWTRDEIAGLFALEKNGRRRIIPVWLGVSKSQVEHFSSILSERRAILADWGIDKVLECVIAAIEQAGTDSAFSYTGNAEADVDSLFSSLGAELANKRAAKVMRNSPKGVEHLHSAQKELFDAIEARVRQIIIASPELRLKTKQGEFRCIPNDIMWLNVELRNGDILRVEATRARASLDEVRLDLDVFRPKRDQHGEYTTPDVLERHCFAPDIDGNGAIEWKNETGSLNQEDFITLVLRRLFHHVSGIEK